MSVMHTPLPRRIPGAPPRPAPPPYRGRGATEAAPAAAEDARLSPEDYAAWLLPPQPRDGTERFVHALSLAAGVIALTGGFGALWWIL